MSKHTPPFTPNPRFVALVERHEALIVREEALDTYVEMGDDIDARRSRYEEAIEMYLGGNLELHEMEAEVVDAYATSLDAFEATIARHEVWDQIPALTP